MKSSRAVLAFSLTVGSSCTNTAQAPSASGEVVRSSEGVRSASSSDSPKEAVRRAALILDVRTPEEFGAGHLDRAENVPVDQLDARIEEVASKLGGDRSKPVVVYCAAGGRAGRAKAALEKAGFTSVTNAGGYDALK